MHFGGLGYLEPFWGKWGPKNPKYSREIGIFHVKLKTPITQKRRHIERKLLNFTIANRGRSFRIRHLCLPMTSPSGRNGDHVTSGPHSKCNSTETVRDTQKFTITDKYIIAYGLSEYVNIRLLWQPEVGQTAMTSHPVHKERPRTWKLAR